MKNALIEQGIPANCIYLDYAGFCTFDSMFRMKEIFGQKKFTIISQQFHNERAIYIARFLGIEAIGYNAKDVDAYWGIKTKIREKISRIKMVTDLIFKKKSKFLGTKIIIK